MTVQVLPRVLHKPTRWNWSAPAVHSSWSSIARGLIGVLPYWEGGGRPWMWIQGVGWTEMVPATSPTWTPLRDGYGMNYNAGFERHQVAAATLPANWPGKVTGQPWTMFAAAVSQGMTAAFNRCVHLEFDYAYLNWHNSVGAQVQVGAGATLRTFGHLDGGDGTVGLPFTVATSYDLTNVQGYLDGVQKLDASAGTEAAETGQLCVGGSQVFQWWNADVKVVYFWDRCLQPAEIAQIHRDFYGLIRPPEIIWLRAPVGGASIALAGTADGTSTTAGALTVAHALAGAVAGTSTVAGDLTVAHALIGTADGTSTVAGDLSVAHSLAGTTGGTSTVAGDLSVAHSLVGAIAGTSTVTGVLTLAGTVVLAGTADGTSTVAGDLSVAHSLSGAVAGTSTVAGDLTVAHALVGTASGTSTATATLTMALALQGAIAGVCTVTATLTGGTGSTGPYTLTIADTAAYTLAVSDQTAYSLTVSDQAAYSLTVSDD